ncbi:MAG TPA: DUF4350 domain-containing protein [Candidatus Sulfomarinibacteraceae bacterium]|nr:DUF4350 domain-containing protein [Candidatus Sulfomarinibacteraceae bacterium]
MIRLRRDTWLTLFLLLLLVGLTALAIIWEARDEATHPPLATFSSEPDGARALWLWLERLGHSVDDSSGAAFAVPEETDLVIILEPQMPGISDAEWEVLDDWTANGGVLLIAGEGFGTAISLRRHQFDISYLDDEGGRVQLTAPLLLSPISGTLENTRPRAKLRTEREDVTTILTTNEEPVLVAFTQGEGLVLLSTLTYPFSNEGLKEPGNPQLALNVAALAGSNGSIWFDEWHHGRRASESLAAPGPGRWLREAPAGRALLYAAAVLFLAILLRGRRFGRPVPLAEEQRRRAPAEHLTAIANLNRRAGNRQAVLHSYRQELKRGLGRRYRLPPSLPDEAYLNQLRSFRADLDVEALNRLLQQLKASDVSEAKMVQLAREVSRWLDHPEGRQ